MKRTSAIFLALAVLVLSYAPAAPAAQTAASCRAAKLKAVGTHTTAALKCWTLPVAPGTTPPDAACASKADDKFAGGFAKIESRGGCDPSGDLDAYTASSDDLVALLGPSLCPAKLKAVGKYAKAVLGCYAKAVKKGTPVEGECLTKAAAKLAKDFAKADAKGCTPTGDVTVVQAAADAFVAAVQCGGFDQGAICDPDGFECGPNAISGAAACAATDEICMTCPPGTRAIDNNADGCEEACNPCPPLSCPSSDPQHPLRPYDDDGDACPDTCPSANAISGQCVGLAYASQCDPDDFDCGPNAIMGDVDCDGTLEVCIPCPDDTRPVDHDGDGCEEVCDGCAPVTCSASDPLHPLPPFDADGDGCRESCPCTEAVAGRCAGFPYPGACAAGGALCGGTTIATDQDCDGDYDVCAPCPAGTQPVDRDGDGCDEVCECSIPVTPPPGGGPEIVALDEDGVPKWVKGEFAIVAPAGDPTLPASWTEPLRTALVSVAAVMHIAPSTFTATSVEADALGERHIRLSRVVAGGVPVLGDELIAHVRDDGTLYSVNGDARADREIADQLLIDKLDAAAAALAEMQPEGTVAVDGDPTLAFFRPDGSNVLHLAWVVQIVGDGPNQTVIDEQVIVSAQDAAILERDSNFRTAKDRAVHDAEEEKDYDGPLIRDETTAPVSDADVNACFDNLGTTYDCYAALFARDSYDGGGSRLKAFVHFDVNLNNAAWNRRKKAMVYGDGDDVLWGSSAESFDVTAHEVTHGVTASTSKLRGWGEPAAIDETLADVMSSVCQWWAAGNVISATTWMLGDDVVTPSVSGDALRYMNDPSFDGESLDYYPDYNGEDEHQASGIGNLAFYLLVVGGTHPQGTTSVVVPAIGMAKSAQIWHRANTLLLSRRDKYRDFRVATIQAASELGYTHAEVDAVRLAWDAVGVTFKQECDSCTFDFQCEPTANCKFLKCATGNSVGMGGECCRDFQCSTGSCNSDDVCQCTNNSHCPGGQYCAMGFLGFGKNKCVPFKNECEGCLFDYQCAVGAQCKFVKCATGNSIGMNGTCCRDYQCTTGSCNTDDKCQCTHDGHCPSGQRCAIGFLGIGKNKCEAYTSECGGCVFDFQCAPGAECKWAKCATEDSLTTGQTCCRDFQCINGNCKSNNKCN